MCIPRESNHFIVLSSVLFRSYQKIETFLKPKICSGQASRKISGGNGIKKCIHFKSNLFPKKDVSEITYLNPISFRLIKILRTDILHGIFQLNCFAIEMVLLYSSQVLRLPFKTPHKYAGIYRITEGI